ncbi:hypothetical protein SP15_224A [Bacillus phage SP-15]|uniref:Uncharacterized protein n=1 Tax=Bacillus phage SP-15 TaxID=1792032 RepID=A0A127AWD9_9CAUD|nr:hypothetical protein SP15_224A [Bacillus phage SP-15]AMM45026.1 hypothetical protein SP15_224A [Bacillus phage SP-15]
MNDLDVQEELYIIKDSKSDNYFVNPSYQSWDFTKFQYKARFDGRDLKSSYRLYLLGLY